MEAILPLNLKETNTCYENLRGQKKSVKFVFKLGFVSQGREERESILLNIRLAATCRRKMELRVKCKLYDFQRRKKVCSLIVTGNYKERIRLAANFTKPRVKKN